MKIILANSTVNSGNRGCVALSLSVMYLLDQLLRKNNIQYTFFLPQSGFSKMGDYSLKIGSIDLKYKVIADISSFTIQKKVKNIFKYKEYLASRKIYQQADFIFDIGQGDSFSDIYGKNRFDWIFSQYELGMKFKIPYCILPQTIGPFADTGIRKRAIKGIDYSTCVLVRDKQSYDFVKQLLPQKIVSEIIDVAFFMPYQKKNFEKEYIHVGLNVSALLWHGGYTGDNQFGLKVDYKTLIRNIISYCLSLDRVKVHLIPHVVDGERTVENDYAVSYDLYEEFNNPSLILAPLFLDPIIAKSYIAGMDFFMGARMHATIGAFSSGVPVVPMAYSRKFNGLFIDTLQYKYMVDLKTDDDTKILEIIKSFYGCRFELKNQIEYVMNTIVSQRRELLETAIKDFMNIQ